MTEEQNIKQDTEQSVPVKSKPSGWWRPVLLIATVIFLLVIAKVLGFDAKLGKLQDWIRGLGFSGYFIFVLIYAGATVAAIPGMALTLGAGALFGSVIGVILVSIASTAGAGLAFLIARYFARDAVLRSLLKNDKFKRLYELTESQGAMIVVITRLVPLFPFNLLNYGFGLTNVHFVTYMFWSWVCMLPGTILYVTGVNAVTRGVSEGRIPWKLLAVVGAVVILLLLIVPIARRKIKEARTENDPDKT